jgi:2'-hydroxyisoflavone reductase
VRLLVLGGTRFLGRAVVEAALARGHKVTLFNRGRTNPELFPDAEKLRGDRDGGLAPLEGRRWDAVVDPSGYVPRLVRASAELLGEAVDHYVFVSSISVYSQPQQPGFDEDARTVELAEPTREDYLAGAEAYGGLKALCERAVVEALPGAHANVRAGLVVGPHDPTGRFTYWPLRIARGGQVLAPDGPDRRVQIVDARDLGEWLVRLCEERTSGTFNAVGPERPLTMGELLDTCDRAGGAGAEITWVDERFLLEHGVGEWMELPLWVPREEEWFQQADVSRAVAAGLRFRPLEGTVADTLAWARQNGASLVTNSRTGTAGMAPEREAELLATWRSRAASE